MGKEGIERERLEYGLGGRKIGDFGKFIIWGL